MSDTSFEIVGIGTFPTSDWGIRQTIEPITNGRTRRKLSGRLYSTDRPQFRQFKSTVTFDGMWPAAIGGIWPGATVTVHCAVDLPHRQHVGEAPIRPVVPGSLRYFDAELNDVEAGNPGAVWFTYRAVLVVKIIAWDVDYDEVGQAVSSFIEFEEVSADYEEAA